MRPNADVEERRKLETLRETYTAEIARELASKRPDIVVDAGLTYPQAGVPLRNNPAIAKVLAGYRLLHQNALVTVLVRSDIAIPARRD